MTAVSERPCAPKGPPGGNLDGPPYSKAREITMWGSVFTRKNGDLMGFKWI